MAPFQYGAPITRPAVTIQRAIERHTRRTPEQKLAVRVGVSVGDVSWENGDCFGTPVIEASRLCAVANGGQILVADLVRGMARSRGGHTFTSVRELTLKGLPEPVPVCEVQWEPLAETPAAGLPLPPRLATAQTIAMVGREVARLIPELGKRIADLPPPQVAEAETERYLFFEAVTGLLSAASQEAPIMLILDDLQWSGTPELVLLKHVLRRGGA